jgi:hypothetical protein
MPMCRREVCERRLLASLIGITLLMVLALVLWVGGLV